MLVKLLMICLQPNFLQQYMKHYLVLCFRGQIKNSVGFVIFYHPLSNGNTNYKKAHEINRCSNQIEWFVILNVVNLIFLIVYVYDVSLNMLWSCHNKICTCEIVTLNPEPSVVYYFVSPREHPFFKLPSFSLVSLYCFIVKFLSETQEIYLECSWNFYFLVLYLMHICLCSCLLQPFFFPRFVGLSAQCAHMFKK